MATITSDLTAQEICNDQTTGYSLISGGGGGQNSIEPNETDDYIVGANCCSRNPFSSTNRGIVFDATSVTVGAGECIYIWIKSDVSAALDLTSNGGIQVAIGTNTASLSFYNVNGSEDAFGGWKCYVIDPTQAPWSNATFRYIGANWTLPGAGPSKGNPFKFDATRYGKFINCVDGTAGTPATAQEIGDWQGDLSRQWGQFQSQGANSFLVQGTLRLGLAGTTVYFSDSGATINFNENPFTPVAFNGVEILNAGSTVIMNGFTLNALGTTSPGDFTVTDNATVTLTSCSFNNIRNVALLSNTTVTGSTFNGINQLTPNGASITGGTLANTTSATGAIVINAPSEMGSLSGINFNDNNRCIEITTAGTYSFNGHTFGTNTIAVNNSSGGAVIINPSNGCNITQGDVETTAGGSTTVNAIQTNFQFTVSPLPTPDYEWRLYTVSALGSLAGAVELAGAEAATVATQSYDHTFTNQPIAVQIISNDYVEAIRYYTLTSTAQSQTIDLEIDNND